MARGFITEEDTLATLYAAEIASEQGCQLTEPTMTPGMFYHGSPKVDIERFHASVQLAADRDIDLPPEKQTTGIFFTQDPVLAMIMAARLSDKFGGRIYSAELATKNTFFPPAEHWIDPKTGEQGDRQFEVQRITEAKAAGYDSIVSVHNGHTLIEVIALDESVVRRRDDDIPTLRPWVKDCIDALTFFEPLGRTAPEYAPDAAELLRDRASAPAGTEGRTVLVNATHPFYCERSAWPVINFELMSCYADCLVDPRDGSALVVNPEVIVPLNRDMKRQLKAKQRRGRI